MQERRWYRVWGQFAGQPLQVDVLVRKDEQGHKRCWRMPQIMGWARGQPLAVLTNWVEMHGLQIKRLPKGFDREPSGNVVPLRPGRKPKSS